MTRVTLSVRPVLPAQRQQELAVPPPSVGAAAARQGPHGCTGKDGACKGRAGPDHRCAAHKER